MSDNPGVAALIDKAFIEPIRTVMLIDDKFPTLKLAVQQFSRDSVDEEWSRASRLWVGCRNRRWLCDVENRSEWLADEANIQCVAGSDLIVLDYHLDGDEESTPDASQALLRHLATHNHTNLVVVYTSRKDLEKVQLEIVSALRGHEPYRSILMEAGSPGIEQAFEDLVGVFTPSRASLLDSARGGKAWRKAAGKHLRTIESSLAGDEDAEPWQAVWREPLMRAAVEYQFERQGAPRKPVLTVDSGVDWVHCRNVFIALMTKPLQAPESEVEAVLARVRESLIAWNPSAMRSAVAYARAEVRRAGLDGERLSLPSKALEAGWWYSILSAANQDEQGHRADRISRDLLAGVTDYVSEAVANLIATHTPVPVGTHLEAMKLARQLAGQLTVKTASNDDIGHALNAFLSCETQIPTAMTAGSVVAVGQPDTVEYFLCVSPACDMVQRQPSPNYHWLFGLHPWRPTMMLKLFPIRKRADALRDSTTSRWIFVNDTERGSNGRLTLSLRPSSLSDQLTHEVLFIPARHAGELSVQRIEKQRCKNEGYVLALVEYEARIVAQLRAPFAEHFLAHGGRHLSRVGTDYFGVPHRRFKDKSGK